jgi:hypothetical protein
MSLLMSEAARIAGNEIHHVTVNVRGLPRARAFHASLMLRHGSGADGDRTLELVFQPS